MNRPANNDRERVLAATDIVRLIGEHVQLRPKGREFAGLCPFHDDKNPSMQVSPQKQIYKCFSCGAGGSVFDFVMGYHKLTFPEAMKMLADRAGIELTPFKPRAEGTRGQGDSGGADRRKRLLSANELALAFFQQQFQSPAGQAARQYIAKRGISNEMVEQFKLGYAPHSWHALAETVAEKRWDRPAFEHAGLIADGQRGLYDKLRHRLIFPITDDMGRAIAFGGRTLPGNTLDDPTVDAKYLNSPETTLFNKSRTLYGLDLAKKAIIDSKTAVIVEGYTDVIACHQHGRRNVVAALGTAFTAEHASMLRRYCEKVVLIFDGDAAGHKAADRAVDVLFNSELDVAVAILPQGNDPDELLAKPDGEAQWDALVETADDAMHYMLDQFGGDLAGSQTMAGKQDVSRRFLEKLARFNIMKMPAIRKALIVARLAELLHLSEHEVVEELKQAAPRTYAPIASGGSSQTAEPMLDALEMQESARDERAVGVSSTRLRAVMLAQRQLVACLLRDNNLFHAALPDGADLCEAVAPGDMTGEHRQVYQLLHDAFADGQTVALPGLLAELAERGWDDDRRWLTMADVELDAHLGDAGESKLRHLFTEAAEAIRREQRRRGQHRDRRGLAGAAEIAAQDPVAQALALAGRAARLAEQRRDEHDPGRIARTAT